MAKFKIDLFLNSRSKHFWVVSCDKTVSKTEYKEMLTLLDYQVLKHESGFVLLPETCEVNIHTNSPRFKIWWIKLSSKFKSLIHGKQSP